MKRTPIYFTSPIPDLPIGDERVNLVRYDKLMKTPIRFQTIFTILGTISALCLLSPVAVGIASASLTYDGNCYGFTDGAAPCSWWQFAQDQMSYGVLIAFSPAIFVLMGWLTAGGLWFATRLLPTGGKLPVWQAILIPLAAFALGICLMVTLPVITGWRR